MPKLKDYFNSDLKTFVNTDEFAETIRISGFDINIVMDEDTLKEHKLKSGGEGLANSELLFHVAKDEYISNLDEPFVGQRLRVKDHLYEIVDLQESVGMYSITLGGFMS